MLVTTEAIILRSRKQGDTSKIVSMYTLDYGAVDVIAKGAREMKSKFGSALEPFTLSKVTFYKKEGRELYLLSSAEVIEPLRNLQSDLEHIEAAMNVIELLIRWQRHEESHPELFTLVTKTLAAMNRQKDAAALQSILFAYYLIYCRESGFAITLETSEISPGKHFYFDIEGGEIFESDGFAGAGSAMLQLLTPESLAALHYLEKKNIEDAGNLRLSDQACHILGNCFRSYFAFHIENMEQKTKIGKVFAAMKRK